METPREVSTRWMLNQDVRGGVLLSSASPMGEVKQRLGARGMYIAQLEADRYLQLFDNDHHTIVTAHLVARVLPGFECRSGVRPLRRADACHTSWARITFGPAQQTSTARHLLQSPFFVLIFVVKSSAGCCGSCRDANGRRRFR
jgi:hypothetical protein